MKIELKEALMNFVIPRYSEAHRYYHDINHITYMLDHAAAHHFTLTDEQILAINFHDVVYDPTKYNGYNERESAKMVDVFNETHDNVLSIVSVDLIKSIILDTIDHRATTREAELVLDLDLLSLAAGWGLFCKNTEQIRKEYSHVNDEEFRLGRIKFIKSMLIGRRIFHTQHFYNIAEHQAKDNLYRELKRLNA